VDQDGEVVDVYLQAKRDGAAAKRFFRLLLRSYPVAHREVMPNTIHSNDQYENNRAEQSQEATRVRERFALRHIVKVVIRAQGLPCNRRHE
jgi:putative transposase